MVVINTLINLYHNVFTLKKKGGFLLSSSGKWQGEKNGTIRLLTPAVVREMNKHFGCQGDSNNGGPLDFTVSRFSVSLCIMFK